MRTPFNSLWRLGRSIGAAWRDDLAERRLPARLSAAREQLAELRARGRVPRIIVIKQDINEDLYCCPPDSTAREIVESTLLRSGPVSLFIDWNAEFRIINTVDDPECSIWRERATHLKWQTLEFFSSYRDVVPGRNYGQKQFAASPDTIDWGQFDIVVSIDTVVPARITRRFPNTLWCYYVREIKAPAYESSLKSPHPGQDIVLNHCFRLRTPRLPQHVLEFPYHLQGVGCFHRLFATEASIDQDRSGVFVDYHTMSMLSLESRQQLGEFGFVSSPFLADRDLSVPASIRLARRTMEPELRSRLLNSRYFLITPGARPVFGTSTVEAIAAGCLAIGSKSKVWCNALFTDNTTAESVEEALVKLRRFEVDQDLFHLELTRQRNLIDYACCVRPMLQLLQTWSSIIRPTSSRQVQNAG